MMFFNKSRLQKIKKQLYADELYLYTCRLTLKELNELVVHYEMTKNVKTSKKEMMLDFFTYLCSLKDIIICLFCFITFFVLVSYCFNKANINYPFMYSSLIMFAFLFFIFKEFLKKSIKYFLIDSFSNKKDFLYTYLKVKFADNEKDEIMNNVSNSKNKDIKVSLTRRRL